LVITIHSLLMFADSYANSVDNVDTLYAWCVRGPGGSLISLCTGLCLFYVMVEI